MDAPNAPNPASPNVQDQNADAAQGPMNQAEGPTIQNPAQGPINQNKGQVTAVEIPGKSPTQVGQNVPVQPIPQPVPTQPAPTGIVVPTPQMIYQNWIGKKPEFSGKPEENAESHLLSTRDWKEAHKFPEGDKVRHFCLILTGKARLWYELLAPLDDDWPALQNKFRWQYLKIGNTPKQLFHPWGTFKFDENTDTIDSYVLRMSQVVTMLNYGEMQILENFKNTLPYWLYLTLINVNNLRDAIDLSKRVLTMEKLDRQLTGQSSNPFMKATSNDNHLPQNHPKKGVMFDVMETLEINIDCIERLTSLVSDMKMTLDRKQPPYKPKIYQGRSQNQNSVWHEVTWKWLWIGNNPHINQKYIRVGPKIKTQFDKITHLEIDPTVEEGIEEAIEGIIMIEIIIDQIIEIDQEANGTIIGQVIGVTIIRIIIDKVIWDWITDKMPNRLIGTEVRVGIETKIIIMTIQEVGVEIGMMVDPFNKEERNPGPNLTPG